MSKIFAVLLASVFLIAGCGGEKTAEKPAPPTSSKVDMPAENPKPEPTQIPSEWSTVPERICALPSIGSTRADFDSAYRQTATNGVGHIRYNDDIIHATYFDGTGEKSDDRKARACNILLQVLPGIPFPYMEFKNLFPADSANVQVDEKGSDAMINVKNVSGTSATLAKLFPKSGGKFIGSFNCDKATGNFIGGSVMVVGGWQ